MNQVELNQHKLGFWELANKPTPEELAAFYRKQYFDSQNFEKKYSDEEYAHKHLAYLEAEAVFKDYNHQHQGPFKVLDVGCGEGFSLKFFDKETWQATATDYSKDGVERHFPQYLSKLVTGDAEVLLEKMVQEKKTFDLIILNNVLEHLLKPLETMQLLKKLTSPIGAVRVQVPNDFSNLQMTALSQGAIDRKFWLAPHEHMSYFNRDSLLSVFKASGFSRCEALADFPIDFGLMNPDSNYIADSGKGKNCHLARIRIENMLASQSAGDLVAFRRGCGQSGVGRNIIVYGRH